MEEWQKNFVDILETVVDEVEKFFTDISEAFDAIAKDSEEFFDRVQTTISTEFEQFFSEMVDPVFEILEIDEIPFESEWPLTDYVQPSQEFHPACIGCRHFHGQVYSGNLLVCGMHPYGCEGDSCPDWESGKGTDNHNDRGFLF